MRIVIAYIPVFHKGYEKFLNETSTNSECLFLVGNDIISQFSELDYISRKDCIRAIKPEVMMVIVKSLGILKKNKIPASHPITISSFNRKVMGKAIRISGKSWDWWRQVGAVVVKNKIPILTACNTHMLHPQLPYSLGDPRSIFKKGINIELSTSEHAEAMLVAESAKRGISLEGAEIYTSDFPCPPCAKIIARAGFKRCYFSKGYGVLDGEEILKKFNVEIVRINPSVNN